MSEETAAESPALIEEDTVVPPAPTKARWFEKLFGGVDWSHQQKAFTHFAVFALALAAFNWLFARNDPGWVNLNPSPWVILPFYLGFRFGLGWGVASSVVLLIFRIIVRRAGIDDGADLSFTGADFYLFWGVILMGAIGGFTRGVIRRREVQKELHLEESLTSNRELKNQVALLKHNEQDLSSILVAQGLETSGLTLNLQDIIERYADSDRDEAFLNMVRDRCGVRSAAIYFCARNGRATKLAALRSDSAFPDELQRTTMMEHAERTGKIVTQRWFWEPFEPKSTGGYDDFFLAVVAHPRERDHRILIISRMDFEQIHWENFWKIESSFRWYEMSLTSDEPLTFDVPKEADRDKTVDERREDIINREIAERENTIVDPATLPKEKPAKKVKPILDGPSFKLRLEQCRQIEEQMGLEHRLVLFVPGETETREHCEQFVNSLRSAMPPADDLAMIPADGGRFVYGLLTAAPTSKIAEEHAAKLLSEIPKIDLQYFVLQLNDSALGAFAK